jgi:cytochrome c oxidase assembly protein subunit 15
VWAQAAQPANGAPPTRYGMGLRLASVVVLGVMSVQLVLGATMRHTGARLAIPDFPSAYGGAIPPLTQTGITESINLIPYDQAPNYYSPAQVGVHFAHRVWAVIVLAAAVWLIAQVSTRASSDPRLLGPTTAMAGLLIAQVALGALIVWTGLSAANNSVATAHQATGAALLATATLVAIRAHVLGPPAGSPRHPIRQDNPDQTGLPAELMGGTA